MVYRELVMEYDAMLKWYLLLAAGEEPPPLTQQFEEPWTWEEVPFGLIHCQFYEAWSS